ncbi:MAG: hypothetical protein AAB842_02860 [Patescibacteria group bacterium]
MNIRKIIGNLKQHKEEIIEKLLARNGDHFSMYFLIKERFLKNNISDDDEFQKKFCYFYVMRGINRLEKEEFFKLPSSMKNNLELKNILEKLCEIPNNGQRHRLFLSFGTKLLHTIDENLPIYDGNIAKVLELANPTYPTQKEERIQNRISIYDELKECFKILLGNAEIKNYLKYIRQDFSSRAKQTSFDWKDNFISDTKLLDSLLWALHTILKK